VALELGIKPSELGVHIVFVAGERLARSVRQECESVWNARVIDIYGMAEFDAVGIELNESSDISLIRNFQYSIATLDGPANLAIGMAGELYIRTTDADPWHMTGDLVNVRRLRSPSSEFFADIAMKGRTNFLVNFSDGSAISESQVAALVSEFPEVSSIQVQVHRTDRGDVINTLFVPNEHLTRDVIKRLLDRISNVNIDVADSIRQGVIVDCILTPVGSDSEFFHTQRGKSPILVRPN